MEYRTLELNILSAKDLKDVNLFSKMDVYAVVSLTGDPYNPQKAKTHVHRDGGRSPTWNFPMKFTYNESLAQQNRLSLEIKIVSDRTLGDTVIGTVCVPLKELLDNPSGSDSGTSNFQQVTYQVRKPSGKSKGSLNFSYKVGDKVPAPATKSSSSATATAYAPSPAMAYPPPPEGSKKPEPVMAYPAGATGSSSASYAAPYPPPQQHPAGYGYPPAGYPPQPGYGYGYPPQPGYGYPPQQGYGYTGQPGYGYPPQAQKPGKNKFGMGLGAGLLGGALGGLLIGDMVSDAGAYDTGYDAGFDDAGGFDF